MLFWTIFGNFWCPVVTLVSFNSNLSNFLKKSQKIQKKNPKILKSPQFFFEKSKNPLNKLKKKECQKWSQYLKILKNLKIHFFFNIIFRDDFLFCKKKIDNLLVFQY